jgi:sulfate adenylyltransferase subunit 1 (EFTu-like GTPase family)
MLQPLGKPASLAQADLAALQQKGFLRFLACGSVGDGKSTLIDRLLYECKLLLDDQLTAVAGDIRGFGSTGGDHHSGLLINALQAQSEVAYRYFTTPRRKFVVAEPTHGVSCSTLKTHSN